MITVSREILDEVITLAQEYKKLCFAYEDKFFPDSYVFGADEFEESTEYTNMKNAENELFEYISNLDYESIKDLKTLMYLGRDCEYEQYYGMERFDMCRKFWDEMGWNDNKMIEVENIAEKLPLGEYLIKGKEYIGW